MSTKYKCKNLCYKWKIVANNCNKRRCLRKVEHFPKDEKNNDEKTHKWRWKTVTKLHVLNASQLIKSENKSEPSIYTAIYTRYVYL